MSAIFADTFFYLALLNPDDAGNPKALEFFTNYRGLVVTTEFVLVELGNALHRQRTRGQFAAIVHAIKEDPAYRIVPASSGLVEDGFSLYENRPDKEWSLTDCISFVVMKEQGVTDALTADRHFEQAGFNVLLK